MNHSQEAETVPTVRDAISKGLAEHGEGWEHVVRHTLSDDELATYCDEHYGAGARVSFTLWTGQRVYFPGTYDGSDWVASVPRDPCDEKTDPVGGG